MDSLMPPAPTPRAGNVLSNVYLRRTEDVYFAIEHPEGWTQEQVETALAARAIDLGTRVDFWQADSRTVVEQVVLGEWDPDNPYTKPLELADEDLGAGGAT